MKYLKNQFLTKKKKNRNIFYCNQKNKERRSKNDDKASSNNFICRNMINKQQELKRRQLKVWIINHLRHSNYRHHPNHPQLFLALTFAICC